MDTETLTEQDVVASLGELVEFAGFAAGEDLAGSGWSTFEDAGVLTSNAGLVLRTADGSEFQVTVVRSR